MTIKIEIENWKHLPEGVAMEFVLRELVKDAANGLLKSGKSLVGDYYYDNGIEYRAVVTK